MAYCDILLRNPDTRNQVGTPTVFVSHAWQFSFASVIAALRTFVAELPKGSPQPFFWVDVLCVDEHTTQTAPLEWWRTTFREAIGNIGRTLMVLSPWEKPLPLTRAWCLWELYCTVASGAHFEVCLGPMERDRFDAAVMSSASAVLDAFGGIDVARASATNPSDLAMILEAAATADGGLHALNGVAITALRRWVVGRVRALVCNRIATQHANSRSSDGCFSSQREAMCLAAAAANEGGNAMADLGHSELAQRLYTAASSGFHAIGDTDGVIAARGNLAATLHTLGDTARAEEEYRAVLDIETAHRGPRSEETLKTRMNLSSTLCDLCRHDEARVELTEVVAGLTELHGPDHRETLRAKSNLASLLGDLGDHDRAAALFEEVARSRSRVLGAGHWQTLFSSVGRATELMALGDIDHALDLLEAASPALSAQLGHEHEKAVWAREQLDAAKKARGVRMGTKE